MANRWRFEYDRNRQQPGRTHRRARSARTARRRGASAREEDAGDLGRDKLRDAIAASDVARNAGILRV